MTSYLKNANISVTNLEETVRFFCTAMPDFQIRHDSGPAPVRWVHLGTDDTYITINQMPPPAVGTFQCSRPGISHIGFVADSRCRRDPSGIRIFQEHRATEKLREGGGIALR